MVPMKRWILYPALAAGVTLILHFAVGLRFGVSAFVSFIGWPVLGTLVTADDDLAGGWSNPDGSVVPPWWTRSSWAQLAGGLGVSIIITAFDVGVSTLTGIGFTCASLAAGLLAALLLQHRRR
jgi:hypothetical protein